MGATHDAGQSHWLFGVGDDQRIGAQFQLGAVERSERLTLARPADDDLRSRQQRPVKRVQGLAVLHHDKVGDVDNIVDGTQADSLQPVRQPFGRRSRLYVFDDYRGIARAELRLFVHHCDFFLNRSGAHGFGQLFVRCGQCAGFMNHRPHFARHADMAQAIAAVGRHVQLDHLGGAATAQVDRLPALDFQTAHGEQVAQFLNGEAVVDVGFQPVELNLHFIPRDNTLYNRSWIIGELPAKIKTASGPQKSLLNTPSFAMALL